MTVAYLQKEEVDRLLSSIAHPRDRLIVRFLYESGCSVSEVSALKATAVHEDGRVTFDGRTAHISGELANELAKQASEHIFHTRQAPTITPKRVQQIVKPYLAGMRRGKDTPHLLRYSHIVHAYKQGLPMSAISKQTGLSAQRLAQILGDISIPSQYTAVFGKGGKA